MDKQKLDIIRGRLVSTASSEAQRKLYTYLFDAVEEDPMSCMAAFMEMLKEEKIPDKDTAYILGVIAGLGVALALDMGFEFRG